MRKAIALVTAGALVLVAVAPANAQASPRRYCGTTTDGFPGVTALKPTTCGFARNVGTTSGTVADVDSRLLVEDAPDIPNALPTEAGPGVALRQLHGWQSCARGPGVLMRRLLLAAARAGPCWSWWWGAARRTRGR